MDAAGQRDQAQCLDERDAQCIGGFPGIAQGAEAIAFRVADSSGPGVGWGGLCHVVFSVVTFGASQILGLSRAGCQRNLLNHQRMCLVWFDLAVLTVTKVIGTHSGFLDFVLPLIHTAVRQNQVDQWAEIPGRGSPTTVKVETVPGGCQ